MKCPASRRLLHPRELIHFRTASRNEYEIRGRPGWRRIASLRPGLRAVEATDSLQGASIVGRRGLVRMTKMTKLEDRVRRWFGHSQQPLSPPPSVPTVASPPASVSALDQKVDAAIAAAETSIARSELLASFAADNNAFALALFHTLRGQGGNQFLSPFSIRSALMMAYAGARGETAAEMR